MANYRCHVAMHKRFHILYDIFVEGRYMNTNSGTLPYYWFYYSMKPNEEAIIRIRAKRKPGENTRPKSGTWIVRERFYGAADFEQQWVMPAFPEVTWGTLSKMHFQGKEAA